MPFLSAQLRIISLSLSLKKPSCAWCSHFCSFLFNPTFLILKALQCFPLQFPLYRFFCVSESKKLLLLINQEQPQFSQTAQKVRRPRKVPTLCCVTIDVDTYLIKAGINGGVGVVKPDQSSLRKGQLVGSRSDQKR